MSAQHSGGSGIPASGGSGIPASGGSGIPASGGSGSGLRAMGWSDVLAIAWRQVRQNLWNPGMAALTFAMPLFFGLLAAQMNPAPALPQNGVSLMAPGAADPESSSRFLIYWGIVTMFVLMTALMNGAALLEEREGRTMARLIVQGVTYGEVIVGHSFALWVSAFVQMVILLGVAAGLGFLPAALLPMVLLICAVFSLTVAALGVAAAGFSGNANRLRTIGGIAATVVAMLGGAWWPLELSPEIIRQLGTLSPIYWVIEATHRGVMLGATPAQSWLPLLALLLFAGAGGTLGVWATRRWFG